MRPVSERDEPVRIAEADPHPGVVEAVVAFLDDLLDDDADELPDDPAELPDGEPQPEP